MAHTVGETARLAKVSVRTLHHYDELGVLRPTERSEAGYRLYTDDDLVRLQQVLLYKELGFPLDEIARIVDRPGFDRMGSLLKQREMLAEKVRHTQAILDLVDKTILATEGGIAMDKEEMFEVFGDFDPAEHEDEVKERWGDTDAYKESNRRVKGYTKEDWLAIKEEGEAVESGLAELLLAGVPADDPRAMDLAEKHRLQIDRWFYPLSYEMQVGLADMYIMDARFTKHYDDRVPGLAAYLRDAIYANALRATE